MARSRSTTKKPTITAARSLRHETIFAGMVAALLSIVAYGYCSSHNLLLLYGDAVAHLHIARRILDSLNPGIRQIGSVWLPFPHLLMMPFVMRMAWWQSGVAGAIPSMACYVLSVAGLWRLARYWLGPAGAVVAALFFALNPGLLYMQTTAMTEPLFLCQIIWSTLFLTAFLRALNAASQPGTNLERVRLDGKSLTACGLILFTAIYTRYDGWILAALVWLVAAIALARAARRNRAVLRTRAAGAFVLFTALLLTGPILWFAWNARQYGDWLDFMRGPYSAKAIDIRTSPPGSPHYPGWHSLRVAEIYFLKAAELGAAPERWSTDLLYAALIGLAAAIVKWRKCTIVPALLLWMPAPFYAYSIAYGSVPIHIPIWWPFSWYNTRYGMELLPAFALSLGFLIARLMAFIEHRWPGSSAAQPAAKPARSGATWSPLLLLASIILIILDASFLIRHTPLVLAEAIENARTRVPFEAAYARALDNLPPNGAILVWTSDHIGAFQRAGIPLRRTINETDYYPWKAALAHPAQSAEWIIAADNDAVTAAITAHPENLKLIDIVCSTGQPCIRFYHSTVASAHR